MATQEDTTRHIEEPKPHTSFPDLPIEIRLAIWKYAMISPREILADVIVLVNFDLESPRAILPSLSTYRAANEHIMLDDQEFIDEGFVSTIEIAKRNRKQIFALMQTCVEAREVVLSRYILDCASTLTNTTKLWQSDDTLCITQHGNFPLLNLLCHFKEPLSYFDTVRHLALFLDVSLLSLFPALTVHSDEDERDFSDLTIGCLTPECIFRHFPNLETLDLLLDPVNNRGQDCGKLVLYEPIDKPIVRLEYTTPSAIERKITGYLEAMSKDGWFQGNIPVVECAVVCWKKPKFLKTSPRSPGFLSNALSMFHGTVAGTIPPRPFTMLSGAALVEAQARVFGQAATAFNPAS
ncbi:hypothetical protein BGZ60DRAFT_522561 [Tricladium varicosporioides]|nr:hypothetical protein BGZ60DRAFT_522561 [Hymenoscyphus varicosporioides]